MTGSIEDISMGHKRKQKERSRKDFCYCYIGNLHISAFLFAYTDCILIFQIVTLSRDYACFVSIQLELSKFHIVIVKYVTSQKQ